MYNCETCGKVLKSKHSLERHKTNIHGSETKVEATDTETLEVEVPAADDKIYECGNCGNPVNRNMSECPKCSQSLEWSKV
jgi:rubrerythrin